MTTETKIFNIDAAGCYPVTILKYLLNLKKIVNLINKAENGTLKMEPVPVNKECEECKKSTLGKCRAHTCLERIVDPEATPVYDRTNGLYMIKNEIFKRVGEDKVIVFYCPHTKLCTSYTDKNIRKIDPYLFDGAKDILPDYTEVQEIDILELASNSVRVWFNDELNITTLPQVDRRISYYLRPNK